ncbi:MAG: siderophore-interacting protein [Chloroflexi bacterium]|nr:siderophore-interacting protein [Chloroflexota bacterium]MCC6892382.1 siderophore-interacting protein [Anaerolineae bacterium]
MTLQTETHANAMFGMFRILAHVVRAADISPHMRRVTLGGEGLRPLVDTVQPADAIKLYLPLPGGKGFMPKMFDLLGRSPQHHLRAYTVRSFRPEALELDIDVFIHGETPGSVWARTVQAGEQVGFIGPRHDFKPPTEAQWYVLAGDESALPAIASIIERLPTGTHADAFIEVIDAADELPINTPADVRIQWLHRGSKPTHQSDLLEKALRGLQWQSGQGYCWAAGEAGVIRKIRTHLQSERGLPKTAVQVMGYWKQS